MTNQTRKRPWLAAMTSLAVFGVLAAVVALSVMTPQTALAHNCADEHPEDLVARAECVRDHVAAGLDPTDPTDHTTPMPEPMPTIELTAPTMVSVAALDNTMTVRWSPPQGYDEDARVVGYEITQTLYVQDQNNPIASTPPMMKEVEADDTEVHFWGLSYSTYYSHTVEAIFAYEDADGNPMMENGPVSPTVTKRTADSGGILYPAETPPTMPMSLTTTFNVEDAQICLPLPVSGSVGHVALAWEAPSDAGQGAPPNLAPGDCDGDCRNVTPPHTGGDNAGIALLGADATIVSYIVERRTDGGSWTRIAIVEDQLYYADTTAMSGMTYEYRVSARNSVDLVGPPSMTDEIEIGGTINPPARPSSLVATIKSPTGDDLIDDVELQWDPPLGDWRTPADSGADLDSEMVAYCVQRRNGSDSWMTLYVQPHQYSPDGLNSVLTQEYTDGDAPEGGVTYRVAAVFAHVEADGTVMAVKSGPSLWNEATEVKTASHVAPPEPLGDPVGLTTALTSGPFGGTGSVTITWTPAANATAQWVYAHSYTTGSGDYVDSLDGEAMSTTVTGLPSGEYAFIVVAGQEQTDGTWTYSNWSNWSGIVTVE